MIDRQMFRNRFSGLSAEPERYVGLLLARSDIVKMNHNLCKNIELTTVLTPAEEGGYVALNPETGTTTQGETVEGALANLHEATALYLSEFPLARLDIH
jgi:predicted RNase H-like HicB family nuclease